MLPLWACLFLCFFVCLFTASVCGTASGKPPGPPNDQSTLHHTKSFHPLFISNIHLCSFKCYKVFHSPGSVKVFSKFVKNQDMNCQDAQVLVQRKFCPDGGARGKVRRSPSMLGFILWEPQTSTGHLWKSGNKISVLISRC